LVTTQKLGYHQFLAIGIEKAARLSRLIVVSQTERVEQTNPVSFFAEGGALFYGERIFWSDPSDGLILVGLGTAHHFETNGDCRFEELQRDWKVLLDASVVEESAHQGIGPLLLGGFSFDPARKLDACWSAFPDSRFVLPKFMLTVSDGIAWLTTNAVVRANDDPTVLAEKLQDERKRLFRSLAGRRTPNLRKVRLSLRESGIERWMESVGSLAREIRTGLLDKVVLARELGVSSPSDFDIAEVVSRLREEQSSSYIFVMENGNHAFVTASPERLIKRTGNVFRSACVAGSIARGRTVEEDALLGETLLADPKNRIEHEWVVRMIRGVMQEVCSDVDVSKAPSLYKTRDIQHLYTPVVGTDHNDVSVLAMVERLHPTPALAGYPKEVSRRKIREHEPFNRGWYGSPVGWIDRAGDGEFAVAIRSGLLRGNEATLFAGCGIVGDSEPAAEYREAQLKFRPMLSALGGIDIDT